MAEDAFGRLVEAGQASRGATADPLEGRQWYLGGSEAGSPNIGVRPAWRDYTGAGVTVGIWDDGVDYRHPDLEGNYDPALHIPIGAERHDPAPQDPLSRHGTCVAGVIAAERDGRGTVGIAYGATIAAVDIFHDPDIGFLRSFESLGQFAVTNHSWTLAAFQANRLDDEWQAFFDAWRGSVDAGRGGLGTINVVAAGNGRLQQRHTNDSNMASIPEVIVVGAVGRDGRVAETSSPGASLLVSAPGEAIWTTDRPGVAGYSDGWNEAGNRRTDYTGAFGGTSAATPMVSAVAALMLEANPLLGWRDVQEILALSARHVGSAIGSGTEGFEQFVWQVNAAGTWNGGGLHFSNDYGFGLLDARAAVRLAETWVGQNTSANRLELVADEWSGSRAIPDDDAEGIGLVLRSDAAVELEVVGLRLEIAFGRTSDYEVRLVSPGGTESVLATAGGPGTSATGGWSYVSNAFRGETGAGDWELHVADLNGGEAGTLISAELDLFGAAATVDDVFVFTEEFSDLAGGPHGHARTIGDTDGGVDTLNAAAVRAGSRIDLSAGRGRIDGEAVEIVGIERVFTGDGPDRLVGDDAANRLDGGRGDDVLRGGGGRDRLVGADGADRLFDGRGRDALLGGAGRDVFVLERDGQADVVRDFRDGSDRLKLADVRFADLAIRDLDGAAVRVAYADERLTVRGLGTLDADDFSASDFLFA